MNNSKVVSAPADFNSSKVRLKEVNISLKSTTVKNFNSSKVRLKEAFLDEAIANNGISIPQRFD